MNDPFFQQTKATQAHPCFTMAASGWRLSDIIVRTCLPACWHLRNWASSASLGRHCRQACSCARPALIIGVRSVLDCLGWACAVGLTDQLFQKNNEVQDSGQDTWRATGQTSKNGKPYLGWTESRWKGTLKYRAWYWLSNETYRARGLWLVPRSLDEASQSVLL